MGQHKLKQGKPDVYVGARGNKYYCRNRCGRVAYTKGNKEIFVERQGVAMYGWCKVCREEVHRRILEQQVRVKEIAAAQAKAEHLIAHVGGKPAADALAAVEALQRDQELIDAGFAAAVKMTGTVADVRVAHVGDLSDLSEEERQAIRAGVTRSGEA